MEIKIILRDEELSVNPSTNILFLKWIMQFLLYLIILRVQKLV